MGGRTRQEGFTLIEVMMSLVILSVVLLGLASVTGSLVVRVTESGRQTEAMQLVQDRLALVQLEPDYEGLEALYEGVEDAVPGHPGYERETEIEHLGGPGASMNHHVITVSVRGNGLPAPVSRTVAVGAP